MEPKESGAEEGECVIRTKQSVFCGKNMNALAEGANITGPNPAGIAVDREIEARLAEPSSSRSDLERAISQTFRPHDDDRIAVRERKHDLYARVGVTRQRAG